MENQNNNSQQFNPNNNQQANQQVTQEQIANDIQSNKAMAIISYFGILSLIPFFAAKQSPFAQFHAKQGLTLFLIYVVACIVIGIVTAIIPFAFFLLGIMVLAVFIFIILGIVNAAQGKFQKLPLIGDLALKIFKS